MRGFLLPAVHRLRRLLTVVLLALWLPATLHCDLEAAGLDGPFHCESSEPAASHADACAVIENGAIKPTADSAVLPPPALVTCLVSLAASLPPPALVPPGTGLSGRPTAPPEVARSWHFLARSVASPRAP